MGQVFFEEDVEIWISNEGKLKFTQTEDGNLNFSYRKRGESVFFQEGIGDSELAAIWGERVKLVFLRSANPQERFIPLLSCSNVIFGHCVFGGGEQDKSLMLKLYSYWNLLKLSKMVDFQIFLKMA